MNDTSAYRSVRLIDVAGYCATALSLGLALAEPSFTTVLATSVSVGVTLGHQRGTHRDAIRTLAFLAKHPAARYEQVRDALDLSNSDTSDALARLIDAGLIHETRAQDRSAFSLR
ncbi:hypothetical protein [Streptacidiphilus jiangxiensis]|uniref:hypothetical protein n=1 Tax=Streptacidiphilus jiangxiensis TaxID=235985 RepID=UPI0005A8E782|nr:hypothetical protein [Streptacidiphilus jiangxiensis]